MFMKDNILLLLLSLLVTRAGAQQLDINTGGHKASVRQVLTTLDGKYLLSAGEDKTIKIIIGAFTFYGYYYFAVIAGSKIKKLRFHRSVPIRYNCNRLTVNGKDGSLSTRTVSACIYFQTISFRSGKSVKRKHSGNCTVGSISQYFSRSHAPAKTGAIIRNRSALS